MKKKKTIVLCSSVSFYKELFDVQKSLRKMGYKVILPRTAHKMRRLNNFDSETHKSWKNKPQDYWKKRRFMDWHFAQIKKGDAILVVNLKKNGQKGYIGGNVLMEICVAYMYKKPIFILNEVDVRSSLLEEIYGVNPTFLEGDINSLSLGPVISK